MSTMTDDQTVSSGSIAANKRVALGFVQAINDWDLDAAKALVDEASFVEHNPAWGAITFDQMWQTYQMIKASLPDLHFEPAPDLVLGEGDKVTIFGTVSGTHTGAPLFGVPATGKRVEWTGIDISRIAGGKIVERWLNADILGLMRQLGLVPGQG